MKNEKNRLLNKEENKKINMKDFVIFYSKMLQKIFPDYARSKKYVNQSRNILNK